MPTPRQLIDSSFLYALYNPREPGHESALTVLRQNPAQRIIPDVVLPEVTFLFNRAGGQAAVLFFLQTLAQARPQLQPLTHPDLERAHEIMAAYPRSRLDFVDCSIMALAERLDITQVCTFDRRDFSLFRPRHCDFLELLP